MRAWNTPRIWENGECWIIGGGPSIMRQFHIPENVIEAVREKRLPLSAYSPYMESIHSKHIIGVNMALQLGNWVDFCFFGDDGWFRDHRKELAQFTGVKVSCAPMFCKNTYHADNGERIKYLAQDPKKSHGISEVPYTVCWNANSGAAAISLASHLGAKKIVLLGFDMQLDPNGNSHWHKEYQMNPAKRSVFPRHLRGFPIIAADAKRMGIEILNASPESAIDDFPKMTVEAILNGSS